MKDNSSVFDDMVTVAIIGNGPSAINLSFLLSGNWPVYNGMPHPNEILHNRLLHMNSLSFIDQDLGALSNSLEGRTTNQISLLFDMLSNPFADFGMDSPSLIDWHLEPKNKISHVVIGKGQVGGAWQTMDNEVKSLSLSFLLQLPGMAFGEWLKECRSISKSTAKRDEGRATAEEVCRYFQDFVERRGLSENFLNSHTVLGVRKVPYEAGPYRVCGRCSMFVKDSSEDLNPEDYAGFDGGGCEADCRMARLLKGRDYVWEINGIDDKGAEFRVTAVNLVLATGSSDCPNRLGVKGEDLGHVLHSQTEFDALVQEAASSRGRRVCRQRRCQMKFRMSDLRPHFRYFDSPVVIVGSGLSAADAVLYAMDRQISVCHIFRSDYDDVDRFYSSLSPVTYPEYVRVYNLMRGKVEAPGLYRCFPGASVVGFLDNREVIVQECDKEEKTVIHCSLVVVLIGSRPNLSFLDEGITSCLYRKYRKSKEGNSRLLVDVDPTSYRSRTHGGLYAMGPLVGDNFVRFLGGGAVAILSDIVRS